MIVKKKRQVNIRTVRDSGFSHNQFTVQKRYVRILHITSGAFDKINTKKRCIAYGTLYLRRYTARVSGFFTQSAHVT